MEGDSEPTRIFFPDTYDLSGVIPVFLLAVTSQNNGRPIRVVPISDITTEDNRSYLDVIVSYIDNPSEPVLEPETISWMVAVPGDHVLADGRTFYVGSGIVDDRFDTGGRFKYPIQVRGFNLQTTAQDRFGGEFEVKEVWLGSANIRSTMAPQATAGVVIIGPLPPP